MPSKVAKADFSPRLPAKAAWKTLPIIRRKWSGWSRGTIKSSSRVSIQRCFCRLFGHFPLTLMLRSILATEFSSFFNDRCNPISIVVCPHFDMERHFIQVLLMRKAISLLADWSKIIKSFNTRQVAVNHLSLFFFQKLWWRFYFWMQQVLLSSLGAMLAGRGNA